MNATRYEFAVNIYEDQLEEASLCLLHTIIFHRTTGKYVGNGKGFQIGSVGFKDVNCKTIPLTYIMTESQQLHASVQEHVTQFKKQFKHGTRTLNLEVWYFTFDCLIIIFEVLSKETRKVVFRGRTDSLGSLVY